MPSLSDRKEIAAKLRSKFACGLGITPGSIAYALGYTAPKEATYDDAILKLFELLADLIDPTCHMVDTEWDNGECTWGCICKECGSRFEHERAKYLNYCPNCGARVVRDEA